MPPAWRIYITRGEAIGWENNVYSYIKSYEIFTCPELGYRHSYVRNEWVGESNQDSKGDPTRVIHIFDLPRYPNTRVRGQPDFARLEWNTKLKNSDDADWSNDVQYVYNDSDDAMRRKTSFFDEGLPYWLRFPGAHGGVSNILFMDGHVAGFKAWDPNKMTFWWGNRLKPLYWPR